MTLDDVRITEAMLQPILSAVKDGFVLLAPYLIAIVALKVSVWLGPTLWRKVAGTNKK